MLKSGSFFIFLSALMTHSMAQYASQCELPSQEKGLCMPVYSCKSLLEVFLKIRDSGGQVVSAEHVAMFSQRYCGHFKNVPHVCCAESDIQLNTVGLEVLKNQNKTCGIDKGDRVSNGQEAPLFSFRWMALLVYNDTVRQYKCAGSIISEQYVLTAAHCVVNRSDLLHVRLGEYNISSEFDCIAGGKVCAPPVEDIEIEDIIVHENYVKFLNDIALIRLKRKVQYQDHINPVCLPIPDFISVTTAPNYTIAGWGRTENQLAANVLMVASVPHVPLSECQAILRRHRLRTKLTEAVLCAGNTGWVDTCSGDSGGPVIYKQKYNGKPRYVQLGIVAFGVDLCGEGNTPTVYTSVSNFMQWITDSIRL